MALYVSDGHMGPVPCSCLLSHVVWLSTDRLCSRGSSWQTESFLQTCVSLREDGDPVHVE